jgi:hypothetical protein
MEEKNEQVEEESVVEEDLTKLDDTTDWKAKAEELEQKRREEGIKNRERTKALKAQLADLNKPQDKQEIKKPEEIGLLRSELENLRLQTAGITNEDEVELVNKWKEDTGRDVGNILGNKIFKQELEDLRTERTTAEATSNIRGGGGVSKAKETAEYWEAKGAPPTPADVPDRKTRANIIRGMMASAKKSKTFYND